MIVARNCANSIMLIVNTRFVFLTYDGTSYIVENGSNKVSELILPLRPEKNATGKSGKPSILKASFDIAIVSTGLKM